MRRSFVIYNRRVLRTWTLITMNVLVYSGPEILPISLNHTISSLKHILLPNYTVQPITQHTLTTQPWQSSCALLVVPRGANRFVSKTSKQIKDFVEGGGKYLMLGTDATVTPRSSGLGEGAASLSFGLGTISSEGPLKFFDRGNNAYITCGDSVENRVQPRLVSLESASRVVARGIYDTEAARFDGFSSISGIDVVARSSGVISGVVLGIGKGHAAFWGPSIEYSLREAPAAALTAALAADEVAASEESRIKLFAQSLVSLGLKVPSEEDRRQIIARPLPQFLTSSPDKPTIVPQILDALVDSPATGTQLTVFKDENDEFHFHTLTESADLIASTRAAAREPSDPATWQPKHIVVSRDGKAPPKDATPLFDVALFFAEVSTARTKAGMVGPRIDGASWGLGEALIYGEAVTSTQTMLEKNHKLLTRLPVPMLSIATHQLSGRGRGGNVWLSPAGCLMFSLTLRLSPSTFPTNKLVFVQYVFSLAVAEACRDEAILGPIDGEKVRLKWPNDLYAVTGPNKDDLKKIGGVLINTSFFNGKVDIIIGCGINILNPPPITSLSQLKTEASRVLSMERSSAVIMAKFEEMWATFVSGNGSFVPFNSLYMKRWLHSDQLVTLTTTTPHTPVRITGITLDHGLLRTLPERAGMPRYSAGDEDYIDLQPDGNSFDLMANLIKTKV